MIRAIRYIHVDDVLAIVAWDASDPSSKAYAKAITSCLAVAYQPRQHGLEGGSHHT